MSPTHVVLRGGGTALVLSEHEGGPPSVLHWGADLPDAATDDLPAVLTGPVPHNAPDVPWRLTVLPTSGEGWLGTPGYAGHRAGAQTAPRWASGLDVDAEGRTATVRAVADIGLEVVMRYRLDEHGVLVVRTELTNTSGQEAALDVAALRVLLPLPTRADEVLDLTGRWVRERVPQRHPLGDGSWVRFDLFREALWRDEASGWVPYRQLDAGGRARAHRLIDAWARQRWLRRLEQMPPR